MRGRLAIAQAVLIPYVVSRLVVLGALLTARHVFSSLRIRDPVALHDGLFGWDASWYRDIARGGYDAVPREGLRFFPLFPLLGRAVAWLPGVTTGFALLLVVNVSALVLGFVVYGIAMHERSDAALARRAVWLVYLVPPAFVLVMGYAEATFMTLAALTLYLLRTKRWWLAAIAAFLGGLTRPVGVLLTIPAAVEGWQRRDWRAVVPGLAPLAGLFVYLGWAANRAPDFFYPLRTQQDPIRRGHWVDPFRAVGHAFHELFDGDHVSAGVHAVAALVFVVLLVVLARRWPLSFTLYAGAALLMALSSSNLDSLERYGLATVPFVLAGADVIGTETRERIALVLVAAGLVAASILAFTGVLVP
jgi:hypothetical protein